MSHLFKVAKYAVGTLLMAALWTLAFLPFGVYMVFSSVVGLVSFTDRLIFSFLTFACVMINAWFGWWLFEKKD